MNYIERFCVFRFLFPLLRRVAICFSGLPEFETSV